MGGMGTTVSKGGASVPGVTGSSGDDLVFGVLRGKRRRGAPLKGLVR